MAQNVIIAGVTFPDVPSISVPISGGGDASYVDTSDANATAGDILTGKTAYVNGVKLTGTGGGGGNTKYGISIDNLLGATDANGVLQVPAGGNVDLVISGFTDCADYVLAYKMYYSGALKTVTVDDLTSVTGSYAFGSAFSGCPNLQSIVFSDLVTVSARNALDSICSSCSSLINASFPSLETIYGLNAFRSVFSGCGNLESINFSSVKSIGNPNATSIDYGHFYTAFANCNKLKSITLPALEHIYCNGTATSYGTFYNNTKIEKFYFPSLKTISKTDGYTVTNADLAAQNIFRNCSALTEIHFALANQTTIEASTGYATKWGAPAACNILFDL